MASEVINHRLDRVENRSDENMTNVAELKGAYEHLATKADLESVKTDLERVEKRLQRFVLAVAVVMIAVLTYIENLKLDEILSRLP